MTTWNLIMDEILDLIDYGDEDRPIYCEVTNETRKYLGAGRTQFRDLSKYGYSNEIWLDEKLGNTVYKLYTLFHECWHALQKKKKSYTLSYTKEDREKYFNHHQMMLYKYDFEAEATGYASAFIYYMYKINTTNRDWSFGAFEDSYDNVESFPEDQFDTHEDYIIINEKIKSYYLKGKDFFNNLFDVKTEQLSNIIEGKIEISQEKYDKANSLYNDMKIAISQKGKIFSRINNYL